MSVNQPSPDVDALASPLAEGPELALDPYSEADDAATRFLDTPRPDPHWLVQVTLFDRRIMSSERLLAELQQGRLVQGSTPVWRAGMRDWRAAAFVHELQSAAPFPLIAAPHAARSSRTAARSSRTAARAAWLCGAVALLALSLTLYALASAGVFTPSAARPQPTSLTASVQAR